MWCALDMNNNVLFRFECQGIAINLNLPDRSDYIQNKIANTGTFYEIDLLSEVSRLPLREGAVCDIGANIGNHSVFFAAVLGREVHAFEPLTQSYQNLLDNIAVNDLEALIKPYNMALGASPSTGIMRQVDGNLGASKFYDSKEGEVVMSCLDIELPHDESIALIKIDVEGYEEQVLLGATETIKRCKPLLIIECQTILAFAKIRVLVEGLGYIPLGQKGNTPTVFFVHESDSVLCHSYPTFLIRNDLENARRRIQGQLDHASRKEKDWVDEFRGHAEKSVQGLASLNNSISEIEKNIRFQAEKTALEKELKRIKNQLRAEKKELEQENYIVNIELRAEKAKSEHLELVLRRNFDSRLHRYVRATLNAANSLGLKFIPRRKEWPEYRRQLEKQISYLRQRETDSLKLLLKRNLSEKKAISSVKPVRPELKAEAENYSNNTDRKVRIGIASIEIRRTALSHVIDCLYDQADEIFVYLNDYTEVPEFLNREKITVLHGLGDIGDRGKFYGLPGFNGYYITCDDDISYPSYYVDHCIDGIERYGRAAVVGWHGSLILSPFEDYYTATSRRVLSFRAGRPEDTPVHVIGTGCTAFHTSTISVDLRDFKTSNMADIYFALLGQQQNVPFVVIKHDKGEAIPLDIPDDKPIHRESMQSTGSRADTKELQNKLVKQHSEWRVFKPNLVYARELKTVAYVGRIDHARWKKGGILKSAAMIVTALRRYGHRVITVDLETSFEEQCIQTKDADVIWIYPGDPQRPDFATVEQLIAHCAGLGKQVLVNLSFNLVDERSTWIAERVAAWKEIYSHKVKACLFTNSAKTHPAFRNVLENVVCIPKTIDFVKNISLPIFHETNGIFVGDLQKLLNRNLVGGDVEQWLDELRKALPEVPIYAVRQYGGKVDRDLGVEVIPYTTGDQWDRFLMSCRIVACITPHATFEMIPVEAAGLGIPCVYRPMVQSHSETISSSGIEVSSPKEFAQACAALYRDPVIWAKYSLSSHQRALSQHIDYASASIHQQLIMACASR